MHIEKFENMFKDEHEKTNVSKLHIRNNSRVGSRMWMQKGGLSSCPADPPGKKTKKRKEKKSKGILSTSVWYHLAAVRVGGQLFHIMSKIIIYNGGPGWPRPYLSWGYLTWGPRLTKALFVMGVPYMGAPVDQPWYLNIPYLKKHRASYQYPPGQGWCWKTLRNC